MMTLHTRMALNMKLNIYLTIEDVGVLSIVEK